MPMYVSPILIYDYLKKRNEHINQLLSTDIVNSIKISAEVQD